MRTLLILLFISSFLKLSAQVNSLVKHNCDDFNFDIKSNTRNNIQFISEERYISEVKDSIAKTKKPLLKENKELNNEFQKKFPNKITEHCVHAQTFGNGVTEETSFCSNRQEIFLISKELNYYIFKLNAFEIDDYILFDTENQTAYFTENYPLISDSGKIVFDIGYSYGDRNIINYYKFNDNKKVDFFELNLPYEYNIKSYNIIQNSQKIRLIAELIKYNLKETSSNHYEYDKNDFCRKFLIIN